MYSRICARRAGYMLALPWTGGTGTVAEKDDA